MYTLIPCGQGENRDSFIQMLSERAQICSTVLDTGVTKGKRASPCLPCKSSQQAKIGGRVKILKPDLIYLPAFEHQHHKTGGGRHF